MISQNLASDAVHQICPSLSTTPAYPTTSPSTLIPAKKKPGRKRTKLSKTAQLLANLPTGFTFIGPLGQCNETYILAELKDQLLGQSQDETAASKRLEQTADSDTRQFTIGSFRIDLELVKVSDLKSMRKLLPRTEYKLLKNRKCARLSRFRRKEQTSSLMEINKKLREENRQLRMQLGLPLAEEQSMDVDSSDDEKDSGGADTNQDSDFQAVSTQNESEYT